MSKEAAQKQIKQLNKYHWYTPRFWNGMGVSAWWRLAWRHRFSFSPTRLGIVITTTLMAPCHTFWYFWQELWWGRKIRDAPMEQPPLFIVGHWRSGTTFLHELMVLDPRHTFPTTYECLAPCHFLYTSSFVHMFLNFLMPRQRPMDNMDAGWDRPQEDEFALMNLGVPSIYESLAFPNHEARWVNYLDFEGVPAEEIERWKEALNWFLQRVSYQDHRRIVLKSPPHTGRIHVLAEMFPDAQFVHIVRDPYMLYSSTVRLWRALEHTQGLQVPQFENLEEFVFSCMERMYESFERHRDQLGPDRFCEVRYEDLASDPIGQLRQIYDKLQLDGFDEALPEFEKHVAAQGEYKTNQHQLDDATRDKITRRWGRFFQKYGYMDQAAGVAAGSGDEASG